MKEKHTYSSRLRQEQTQRTREQILEGLVKTMARGIATVFIPAVAREAGVSIPTVYRHFRTKRELIEVVGSYLVQKTGGNRKTPPQSPEELAALVKDLFALYEGADEMLRAAAMSQLAYEACKEVLPARIKMIEDALAPVKAHFAEADWIRLRNVVLVLFTTATVRAFKDYLDLSGEEAASCVSWAILTLARAASQTDQTPP